MNKRPNFLRRSSRTKSCLWTAAELRIAAYLFSLNNIRKQINLELKATSTHSAHSYKITITSPSITIVTLTNIQIQPTHPFLHSGLQISCSQRENSLQQHTETHKHKHTGLFRSSCVIAVLHKPSLLFLLFFVFTFFLVFHSDSASWAGNSTGCRVWVGQEW